MCGQSSDEPLSIVYLLESAELFGGVKIVLQQANALVRRGHTVKLVGPGAPPTWFELEAHYVRTSSLAAAEVPPADLYVATFYTTIQPAIEAAKHHGRGMAVHLCQGFEGDLSHNTDQHPAIDRAYRLALPALTVSEHLAELVRRRFERPARRIPQLLDEQFRPTDGGSRLVGSQRPQAPFRIFVTGPWEFYLKGVPVALDAVDRLRGQGLRCQVVRLSQWPLCDEERARQASDDEFHHHLEPPDVAELLRGCDLLLAPSWPVEGFGLPVLEAFASGVPVVASDIPSFREWAADAAALVPYDDAAAFAEAAADVLQDPSDWQRRRQAGLAVAEGFKEELVADELEATFWWARDAVISRRLASELAMRRDSTHR